MVLRDGTTHTNNIYSVSCGGETEDAGIEDLPPSPCSLGPQGWTTRRARKFREVPEKFDPIWDPYQSNRLAKTNPMGRVLCGVKFGPPGRLQWALTCEEETKFSTIILKFVIFQKGEGRT